ncbi:putative membrane protein [Streptomyces scabiei 87.22]|uniref:Putative membrane protein n=1 Tax=Streptomyces scabiei (strain 87.22) TaxID=680198 RepID=C9Z914_STRSW|nr:MULTISPECIES: hypothetical protein [Streptomyces]MBP5875689.1 hypothetical protein [Streptomyces sp. LBUM 1477]MDX2652146.1 hypothetical protein [Streptomyces scabiei]MDX2725828.1 hypothetical protein [Streptomyces scabiei]MDX2749617.1 hypothetical protein [Streptomyces scabiei]MDX2863947.1 hypothetical protein [Streptomyces scabiei]
MATPGRTASQAGDLIRQFNHDTINTGDGWQYPPHAYSAIGSLAYLVRMLPQAIEQALRPVEHTHEQGRVLIDGGLDPNKAVTELRAAIGDAVTLAQALSVAVDRMHSAVSPMGLDTRGLPGFED